MWTGTAALKNIDQSLQTIRNEVVRLDTQLSQLTESLGAGQRHRVKIINDIAAVRLVEIERGELQQELTAADQQAAQILDQRRAALDSLNHKLETLNQAISMAEAQRNELLERVNQSSQLIVDTESQVQGQLRQDSGYLEKLDQARASDSVAQEANQKAQQAQADLADKARPYQQDTLFMYLWDRNFGTADYGGRLFSRFMDGWVARLINFAPARVNFWNLTEIPKRLAEHAERVAALAEAAHKTVQQLELDALQAAGSKSLELELTVLRDNLDRHDDELEQLEAELNGCLQERAKFVAGEDDYIQRCIERLALALQHQDLQAIHRHVLATSSPTDDKLVLEMQSLDSRLEELAGDLEDARSLHDNKVNKLKELETVRRDFKNSRFDDVRSGFGNESLLAGVMGQFIQGVVTGADLWRTIQRNQRYRDVGSLPDFGSGGLGSIGDLLGGGQGGHRGRKKRGSSWHLPTPRRGSGGFKIPRGKSNGGGFKTGGGF